MVFDYAKLRGRIIEKFATVEKFAEAFGATPTTVGRKLSGKSEWTQSDMLTACELLDISACDVASYFFCKVS